jgi:hypothetical protein
MGNARFSHICDYFLKGGGPVAKRNYEQIALCVLTTPNLKAAAEKAGIAYCTLMRYRKNPEFQEVLQSVKKASFETAMQKVQAMTLGALDTLYEIRGNPALNESARVSAARTILEFGADAHRLEAIEAELAELRKAVMGE